MKRTALLVAASVASSAALAHGSVQGVDHFSGGLLHPLVEPTHLISLVALGLLIGQRGIARSEGALLCFAIGLLVGLLGAALGRAVDVDVPLLAISAMAGGVVALSPSLPQALCAGIAALLGAGIGIGSNPDAFGGTALLAALSGTALGAGVVLLGIVAVVKPMKKPWLAILVRVFGSWTSASAILVLALWLSGKHPTAPADVSPAGASVPLDTGR